jgi:ribonuclease BN (tRNA processing enzyme)
VLFSFFTVEGSYIISEVNIVMKITILGRWGAFPEAGEATSGYLIQEDGINLLLDCGSGVLAQLQKHLPIEELDACLITHFHHDHIADFGCLQYAIMISQQLGKRAGALPVYAPCEPSDKVDYFKGAKGTLFQSIRPETTLQIGSMKISFLKTIHPIYCLAVKITSKGRSLVYTADTALFTELIPFSRFADLLIAETSFYMGQNGEAYGHMNSIDVGKLAKEAEVKRLLLTHLPHFGDQQQLLQEARTVYKGPIHIIQIGESYTL